MDYSSRITLPEYRQVFKEQTEAIFNLLKMWFDALEDGIVHLRNPNPNFDTSFGRPSITKSQVNSVIDVLDQEMEKEAFGRHGRKYKVDASCDFSRLAYPQRLALVQDLHSILLSEDEMKAIAKNQHIKSRLSSVSSKSQKQMP